LAVQREKMKEIRHKRGLSLQQVADRTGFSKSFIHEIETGKKGLTYETALKIASVFNVKPDDIFYPSSKPMANKK